MKSGDQMQALAYALPKHVFTCYCGDHFVMLDLKRNKYQAIDAVAANAFAGKVVGWPQTPSSIQTESPPGAELSEEIATPLVSYGLLTSNLENERRREVQTIDSPTAEINADGFNEKLCIRTTDVCRFLFSSMIASTSLRFRSIERIVSQTKRRCGERQLIRASLNAQLTQRLITVFERLRPFAFAAKDACLFESLALLTFLSHYGLRASWIFGVQTVPFSAHCWIQDGRVVLNDSAERVRQYTPIMIV